MPYTKRSYSLPPHLSDWLDGKAETLGMAISAILARELEKNYQAEIADARRAERKGK